MEAGLVFHEEFQRRRVEGAHGGDDQRRLAAHRAAANNDNAPARDSRSAQDLPGVKYFPGGVPGNGERRRGRARARGDDDGVGAKGENIFSGGGAVED